VDDAFGELAIGTEWIPLRPSFEGSKTIVRPPLLVGELAKSGLWSSRAATVSQAAAQLCEIRLEQTRPADNLAAGYV